MAGDPSASPPVKTSLITTFALQFKALTEEKSTDFALQLDALEHTNVAKSIKGPAVPVELY